MDTRANAAEEAFWADADDDVALHRYRTLVNTVDDGIYQLDATGRFEAVNSVIVELTGYSREELLGEHVSLILANDDVDRIRRAIRERLAGDTDAERPFEFLTRPKAGEPVPCELRLSLLGDDETFDGTVGIVRDISDRKHAKEALDERNQQLESERDLIDRIFEISPIGIQVLDRTGEIVRMNSRVMDLLEIDDPASYSPGNRAVYDEDGSPVASDDHPFARVLETGEPVYERVLRVDLPSGSHRWLSVNASPVRDDDGEIDRVVTTGQDVTALKQRERSLERHRDELATELEEIYGRITDGFIALNEDWEFTHANDRAETILGVGEDDLLGTNLWEKYPNLLGTAFEDRYREAMRTQESASIEAYYPPFDMWFEEYVYPSETGLSVYFRDITDRKEQERRLAESERRYRTLAECFPNGIVTLFDETLEYTLAAGQGFEKIPVEPDDLEGAFFREAWDDATADAIEPKLEATLDGEEETFELEYAGREWVIHTVPVTDDSGEVFVGMTMAQDITERKEYERKLEETVAQLEESNERLEQFAYAASHDLQEPLRMVSSYLALIEKRYADAFDEEGEEFLAFATDGADRMREMIDALLAYSRVETQGDPIEPVDLEEVLEAVLDDLQLQIEETGADVATGDLPRVQADPSQLRQVLQNLVDNALTYRGDDPPEIRVTAERAGEQWIVSVTDNGIGIDPANQDRIFDVFDRLHSRSVHEGTGIGLALCQRIVERHGGEIWVESTPGEGATFSFTLPAPG